MRRTILGAVLVLAAATAHADDKKKAKTLYDQGLNHYNLAEYTDAIKSWKEAYRLAKKPLLLFNIGQAYRLSGDCKQAMIFYDSYQREEPNPKNQDELDEALKLCKDAKPSDKPVTSVTPPVTPTTTKPADKPVTPPVTPSVTTKPADKPVTPPVTTKPADKPADKPVGQVEAPPPDDEPVDEPEPTTTGGGMRKIGIGIGAVGIVLGGAAMAVAGGVMFAIGGPKAVETSSVSVVPTKGGAAFGYSFRF